MQQGLTNLKTVECIQDLVDLLFHGNAILDNVAYATDTYLNTPKLSAFIHHSISHILPLLADDITDYGKQNNDVFHRGAIPEESKEFTDIIDCLQDMYNLFLDIRKQVKLCIKTAIANDDTDFEDFLRDFNYNKLSIYIKQSKTLLEGAKQYKLDNNLADFNDDFEDYIGRTTTKSPS